MKSFALSISAIACALLPVFAAPSHQASNKVPYQTYNSYFESNQSGLKGASSFLAFTNQSTFDKVFGSAAVMGQNQFLPANAFQSKMVLAVIKRGPVLWTYKVQNVSADKNALTIRYNAVGKKQQDTLFASPLIIAVGKKNYRSVIFIENGKKVSKVSLQNRVSSMTGQQVKVFLVALGDNGKIGKKFGCEDSLVPVNLSIKPTNNLLKAAIQKLLALPPDYPQNAALKNFWKGHNLRLKSLSVHKGLATIHITGEVFVAGICDEPRIIEQIEATARQFASVKKVKVFINGQPLAEAIR